MNKPYKINRREFLKVATSTGVGLVIAVYLPGCKSPPESFPTHTLENQPTADQDFILEPNLYLRVDSSGDVTITVHRVEMGQGARTALSMIVAEELDADWSKVCVVQADADRAYGEQTTGGSTAISDSYTLFRRAGAAARQMLVTAAAQRWNVDTDECRTESGMVFHDPSEQGFTYGELVEDAAALTPSVMRMDLKESQDFRIIGTRLSRIDNVKLVDGSAIFGLDVQIPNMLYAVLARSPVFGGKVIQFDDGKTLEIEGVRHVVQISNGVAVVAENTWAALQGRQALEVVWEEGAHAELSSEAVRQDLMDKGQSGEETSSGILQATYEVPFLAHITMEPMNCVADVRPDSCEIWAPTQAPQSARLSAIKLTGLDTDAVKVHIPMVGGGFGRRLQIDYLEEAVEISQAVGAPIKLTWTREDDIHHDIFHPHSIHRMQADLNTPRLPVDRSQEHTSIVPTGAWRSASNFSPAFARECFIDEMAEALQRDPYDLRMELENLALRPVLELAAEKAGWGTPMPAGWGRGIACHSTWNITPTAVVVEVSVSEEGYVRAHRAVCAISCGFAINPGMVEEQVAGGILFALTAALKGEITIQDGRIQQGNFDDYPILRMEEAPEVEVHIVQTPRNPSGVGEMSVPPATPALLNAIYAATGRRIRKLPVKPEDLRA